MDVFVAILSVISFIVSCGTAGYNSTYQMITENPTVEVKKEPESVPEAENTHIINGDFYGFDNKGSGWGFVKKKGSEPESVQRLPPSAGQRPDRIRLLPSAVTLYCS